MKKNILVLIILLFTIQTKALLLFKEPGKELNESYEGLIELYHHYINKIKKAESSNTLSSISANANEIINAKKLITNLKEIHYGFDPKDPNFAALIKNAGKEYMDANRFVYIRKYLITNNS
ncbi:MAG: hypothetical protein P4L22_03905 [Candidatus Babeliales bacterium]|nr:hypothetical protein [Candidatus Babeliales bacterium]